MLGYAHTHMYSIFSHAAAALKVFAYVPDRSWIAHLYVCAPTEMDRLLLVGGLFFVYTVCAGQA